MPEQRQATYQVQHAMTVPRMATKMAWTVADHALHVLMLALVTLALVTLALRTLALRTLALLRPLMLALARPLAVIARA